MAGKKVLTKSNVFSEMFSFEYLYIAPATCSAEKCLWFMMTTGEFMPHASWLCGNYSSGLKRIRCEAFWRALHNPKLVTFDDIGLIFFDQDRTGRYTSRGDHEYSEHDIDRHGETLDEIKARSGRLPTRLDSEEVFGSPAEEDTTPPNSPPAVAQANLDLLAGALDELDLDQQPGPHHYNVTESLPPSPRPAKRIKPTRMSSEFVDDMAGVSRGGPFDVD